MTNNTPPMENIERASEALQEARNYLDALATFVGEHDPERLLDHQQDEHIFGAMRDITIALTRARVEMVHFYEKHGRFAG
jgi:hypothetical protein